MKVIAQFLAFLAAIALSFSLFTFVANRTLWSVSYMERTAQSTHLYDEIATNLPGMVAAGSDPATQTLVAQVLTPTLVKRQLETIMPQLVEHYRSDGPAPTLDLRQVDSQLKAAGVVLPPNVAPQLSTPQTITAGSADATLAQAGASARMLDWAAPLASLVLIGLIILIAGTARFSILATVGFMGGIMAAISGGLVWLAPGLIPSAIGDSFAKPLAPGLVAFARAVARDMSGQLFIGAAVLAVVGLVLVMVHAGVYLKGRFTRPAKHPKPPQTPRPTD